MGPTIETNSVEMLVLNATNPRRSSNPAKAINKKISRVGDEIFVFVIPVHENKIVMQRF